MLSKLLNILKGFINYTTILMIIAVGLFTLFFDGNRYRRRGYMRELRIVKIISYSYMGIGALMFILLLIM